MLRQATLRYVEMCGNEWSSSRAFGIMLYVCMSVCLYVCMSVCLYVCVHVNKVSNNFVEKMLWMSNLYKIKDKFVVVVTLCVLSRVWCF